MNAHLEQLKQQYNIVATVDLDQWHALEEYEKKTWLREQLTAIHRNEYQNNERIVFTMTHSDVYSDIHATTGALITQLQRRLNEIDISNFFVILLTNDATIPGAYLASKDFISTDSVPIEIIVYENTHTEKNIKDTYETRRQTNDVRKHREYNSIIPISISLDDVSEREKYLLQESKTFCIYPWIHFHAYPTGQAYPCCMADMEFPVGNMRNNTIKEIWNNEPMREIRRDMLSEKSVSACTRCYEQEASGFLSGRQSANKHHGHHINRALNTHSDGSADQFELTYWDIRFSNLCNLSCRSCGHIFSSSWYQDQARLAGPEWKQTHQVLNYAGRFETDAWDQLVEHIDYVEQIYFAGGEPLLMEEHYKILDELVKRKRFDVRLIYNTNFTHTQLKHKSVFEYWKLFDSVSIGASLDDMGPRAEYIRKGTKWAEVEANRRQMMEVCPRVDFYISPTLSIMNALSIVDFHRDWVEKGLINAQDLNVNILQDPPHYRIDIAPAEYKELIVAKYQAHIEWLKDKDPLKRATTGFESAINYINSTDNTHLIDTFWRRTYELDAIRNEHVLDIIPELKALK